MLSVRVPATSANIGAGFDTFGAAFSFYNTFEFDETENGKLTIRGVGKKYQDKNNLVYQAMASGQYDFAINDVSPHDGKVTEKELLILFLLDEGGGQKAWAGRVQSTNSTVAFEGWVSSAPLAE